MYVGAAMSKEEMLERIQNPLDRRKFVTRAGVAGLGVAAMTMLGGSLGKLEAATAVTDADILVNQGEVDRSGAYKAARMRIVDMTLVILHLPDCAQPSALRELHAHEGGHLSNITLTLIRYRGTVMPLGRNATIKVLLDKNKPKKVLDTHRLANAARNLWMRNFPRQAA
jgi:hypothetical protein